MRGLRLALTALTLSACDAPMTTEFVDEPPAVAASGNPLQVSFGTTTEGDLALANLDAQTRSVEQAFARKPGLALAEQLLGLWLSGIQYTGRYSDFSRALDLADQMVELFPERPEAWLMRADALSAVHLFEQAQVAVAEAERLGAPDQNRRRTTYWLATGERLQEVYRMRMDRLEEVATYATRVQAAAAAAAVGYFEEADALYVEALEGYVDVSPLPYAWVMFQRGVMWGEMANRPDAARPLYEAAVARLPAYVVANVHLAELERTTDPDGAVARIERILRSTEDPEPLGKLATYLVDRDPARSELFRQAAVVGYDALLEQHAEAFLDHASEFFVGTGGDPRRGLRLAQQNLSRRRNARAYVIALSAADAAEDQEALCELLPLARSIEGNFNLEALTRAFDGACPG